MCAQALHYTTRCSRNLTTNSFFVIRMAPRPKAFGELHKAGVATRALDNKTKELIALVISVVMRCDDCIIHHIHDALEAGATREGIADALGTAILMGGGPSMLYAAHAIEVLGQQLSKDSPNGS